MVNRYLLYGVIISIGIHFIFFLNIEFKENSEKILEIQLVHLPPKFNKRNIIEKKNFEKQKLYEPLVDEVVKINPKKEIKEEIKEEYCKLCEPVKELDLPIKKIIFGETVNSILMVYKVFHDLGPNKGSIKKIKPFGSDESSSNDSETKSISEVGNLKINYKINDNKYEIDYIANAKGITSIFYSKPLTQKSKGIVNKKGLKPEYFLYSHGTKKKSEAFFDWQRKTLTIKRKENIKTHDLIDEAQDQLSFMFQFMFLNPLNKMQIPITNAKVFKIYNYHYVDELDINTKLGKLSTLHVAKFNYQTPERIDLWLAKEYGYLPVKIAITQDDLSMIIQQIEVLNLNKVNE